MKRFLKDTNAMPTKKQEHLRALVLKLSSGTLRYKDVPDEDWDVLARWNMPHVFSAMPDSMATNDISGESDEALEMEGARA